MWNLREEVTSKIKKNSYDTKVRDKEQYNEKEIIKFLVFVDLIWSYSSVLTRELK